VSRFPNAFELAARRDFADLSAVRAIVSKPLAYPRGVIPLPDDDRDPGDEDPNAADERVYLMNGRRVRVSITAIRAEAKGEGK
jgi:hypothetical protein